MVVVWNPRNRVSCPPFLSLVALLTTTAKLLVLVNAFVSAPSIKNKNHHSVVAAFANTNTNVPNFLNHHGQKQQRGLRIKPQRRIQRTTYCDSSSSTALSLSSSSSSTQVAEKEQENATTTTNFKFYSSGNNCDLMGCDAEGESPVEESPLPVRGRKRRALVRSIKNLIQDSDEEDRKTTSDTTTPEELSIRIFNTLDKDNDGKLSRQELLQAGLKMSIINSMDWNRDGEIERDEFLKVIKMASSDTNIASSSSISSTSTTSSSSTTTTSQSDSQQQQQEMYDETIGELEPLERQELRLGGFEPYILVAVLTAQASFETIKDYSFDWGTIDLDTADVQSLLVDVDWYAVGVEIAGAASTLCGLYATVIFSLSILYGKTALGLDRDEAYYNFMDNTGLQRFRAFQAFTIGLFFFCCSVFLVVVDQGPSILKIPLAIGSFGLLLFAKSEYDVIMDAAAPMFLPRKSKSTTADTKSE